MGLRSDKLMGGSKPEASEIMLRNRCLPAEAWLHKSNEMALANPVNFARYRL